MADGFQHRREKTKLCFSLLITVSILFTGCSASGGQRFDLEEDTQIKSAASAELYGEYAGDEGDTEENDISFNGYLGGESKWFSLSGESQDGSGDYLYDLARQALNASTEVESEDPVYSDEFLLLNMFRVRSTILAFRVTNVSSRNAEDIEIVLEYDNGATKVCTLSWLPSGVGAEAFVELDSDAGSFRVKSISAVDGTYSVGEPVRFTESGSVLRQSGENTITAKSEFSGMLFDRYGIVHDYAELRKNDKIATSFGLVGYITISKSEEGSDQNVK